MERISYEEAKSLERILSLVEIKSAVWSCDPSKTSGLDGFNMNFSWKMWDVIRLEFEDVVLDFFHLGVLARNMNMT